MPANLTQQYLMAEERFKAAATHDEKVDALEEMIRELPKHKHTEKMFADLKTRLAKLRREGETKTGGQARHSSEPGIKKEGAGQVVLLGAPNAGKSALLGAMSNAPVEVTEYPFTTRKPVPGMIAFEDVRIQIVDTPSLDPQFQDPGLMPLLRQADAAVICIDLSATECLDQPSWALAALDEARIDVVPGTVHSTVSQAGRTTMPGFIVATHADHPDASIAMEFLADALAGRLPIVPISTSDPVSLKAFARACFDLFGVVRIYCKQPGKEADRDAPFLVPTGGTVLDFAERVHKDFRERFDFARVWGPGKYDGQRVARDYPVEDGDVIELHVR
jgi:ribosome-interacting GTPase 1